VKKQDIEIKISPTGVVSFTVKGVKGTACLDETKFLEDALGNGVLDRQKTSEYYEQSEGYVSTYTGEGRDE
jgi:hypothetical protein